MSSEFQLSVAVAAAGEVRKSHINGALLAHLDAFACVEVQGVSLAQTHQRVFESGRIVDGHAVTAGLQGDFRGSGRVRSWPSASGSAHTGAAAHSTSSSSQNDASEGASHGSSDAASGISAASVAVGSVPHGVGGDEGAHDRVGAGECVGDGGVFTLEFGFIVGQDDDGSAGFGPGVFADVIGGVEHASGDVGTAVEAFLAEEIVKFAIHSIADVAELRADAGVAVEDHDSDAVLISEHAEGIVRGVGDALHVGAHAAADVEEEEDVERHVFAGEIADFDDFSLLFENEIFRVETGDGVVVAIEDLDVDADQGYVAVEGNGGVVGAQGGDKHGQD